jgi:hypothetical protein
MHCIRTARTRTRHTAHGTHTHTLAHTPHTAHSIWRVATPRGYATQPKLAAPGPTAQVAEHWGPPELRQLCASGWKGNRGPLSGPSLRPQKAETRHGWPYHMGSVYRALQVVHRRNS